MSIELEIGVYNEDKPINFEKEILIPLMKQLVR
jgi:hypothetical protein